MHFMVRVRRHREHQASGSASGRGPRARPGAWRTSCSGTPSPAYRACRHRRTGARERPARAACRRPGLPRRKPPPRSCDQRGRRRGAERRCRPPSAGSGGSAAGDADRWVLTNSARGSFWSGADTVTIGCNGLPDSTASPRATRGNRHRARHLRSPQSDGEHVTMCSGADRTSRDCAGDWCMSLAGSSATQVAKRRSGLRLRAGQR